MSVLNWAATKAIMGRQLGSYLANPLGYIFILMFVVVSAAFVFFPEEFYQRNIADFGQLYEIMPWLLVFLLPGLSMSAWSSERENGTEELLLTLPVSVFDAIFGKYLAIVSFYTVAMCFNFSLIIALEFLGEPDWGLLIANLLGWWLLGLAFAALSLAASTLVSLPVIAFVLGVIFCFITSIGLYLANWIEPFNRGVFSIGDAVIALAIVGGGIGFCIFNLSSRRWREVDTEKIIGGILSLVFGVILAFNVGGIADRYGSNIDISAEGLNSISDESISILADLDQPVTLSLFVSDELPDSLQLKAQEIRDIVAAVKGVMGDDLQVEWRYPKSPYDELGVMAQEDYGLSVRVIADETVAGRENVEVFLGAVISSGPHSQRVDYFDPGLSVEYELVRSMRTVNQEFTDGLPVLGVLATGVKMNGGFDLQARRNLPSWQIVDEWKKQYEVREVETGEPIPEEIEVLVAAVPSAMPEEDLQYLHDYIYAGRPCLLFIDPLPMVDPSLSPKMPPQQPNPMNPQQQPPPKANIQPLIDALGVQFQYGDVMWAQSNTSHRFQEVPPNIIWANRELGSFGTSELTEAIDSVLAIYPGAFYAEQGTGITAEPIVKLPNSVPWGKHDWSEHVQQSFFGMQMARPRRYIPHIDTREAMIVGHLTGKMRYQYGEPKPADDAEPEEGAEVPQGPFKDQLSEQSMNVILFADVDMASDTFFQFYRDTNQQFSEEELSELTGLRNVQLLGNCLDSLFGQRALNSIRTRRPQYRNLSSWEEVFIDTQKATAALVERAEDKAKAALDEVNKDFNDKLDEIRQRTDLDERSKSNLVAAEQKEGNRKIQLRTKEIDKIKNEAIGRAKAAQKAELQSFQAWVRARALGIPAIAIIILILGVYLARVVREKSDIPTSRKRSA